MPQRNYRVQRRHLPRDRSELSDQHSDVLLRQLAAELQHRLVLPTQHDTAGWIVHNAAAGDYPHAGAADEYVPAAIGQHAVLFASAQRRLPAGIERDIDPNRHCLYRERAVLRLGQPSAVLSEFRHAELQHQSVLPAQRDLRERCMRLPGDGRCGRPLLHEFDRYQRPLHHRDRLGSAIVLPAGHREAAGRRLRTGSDCAAVCTAVRAAAAADSRDGGCAGAADAAGLRGRLFPLRQQLSARAQNVSGGRIPRAERVRLRVDDWRDARYDYDDYDADNADALPGRRGADVARLRAQVDCDDNADDAVHGTLQGGRARL